MTIVVGLLISRNGGSTHKVTIVVGLLVTIVVGLLISCVVGHGVACSFCDELVGDTGWRQIVCRKHFDTRSSHATNSSR